MSRTLNSEDSSACWMMTSITSWAPSTEGGRERGIGGKEGERERKGERGREREGGKKGVSQPTYWYMPIVKI